MSDDIYSMTKAGFHEAIRQAKEQAWDEGAKAQAAAYGMERDTGRNPYEVAK